MTKPEDSPEDAGIRELVRELVASAPVAPPLPDASLVPSLRRNRTRVAVAVALASLVAIVAGGLWIANRGDDKGQIVIEQPSTSRPPTSVPSTTDRSTPTTVRAAADIFPSGTALIGLDRNTGAVDALDSDGRTLRTLFNAGVETTHHWPTISQLQLAPDRRTLWYAANPTGLASCSDITERDLVTGATHVRFHGSWIALSPDGTRLAYTGCIGERPAVHVADLRTGAVWNARSGTATRVVTAVGYLAWSPNSRGIVVEYLGDTGRWPVARLTPDGPDGAIGSAPIVLTLDQDGRLTSTPDALYVSAGTTSSTWSIDVYDWSYKRISHIPTQLGPLEIVVRAGTTYAIGGPFTGGSGYDTGLYRLGANGQLTEIRHGIDEIVAVPAVVSVSTTTTTATPTTIASRPSTASCAPDQMRFALDRDLGSTMQQPAAFFSFTNTANEACTLAGYPSFEALDAAGNRIPVTMQDGETFQINDPGPHPLLVPPGGVVYFGFGWLASTQPDGSLVGCIYAASARARLPGSDVTLTAPAKLGTPICPTGGSVTAIAERGAFTIGQP